MTEFPDYYQPPRPYQSPPAYQPTRATGRLLVQATWNLLRQDRDLIWLPVVGGLSGLGALALLAGPGYLVGSATGHTRAGLIVGGALGVFLASVVAIYFQAALVLGAFQRADGYDPSFSSTLRQVWHVRRQVVEWALLTTTVGLAIRAIEQRLGILGTIFGFLGGLAWAIASFFTIPVLVAEGLGPVAATRRSATLIKQRWGVSLRSTLRVTVLQLVWMLAFVAMAVVGAMGLAGGGAVTAVGGLLLVVGVIGFLGTAMIASAVLGYARALLYRFSVGLAVPGIPAELYAGAFVPRRRRRGN